MTDWRDHAACAGKDPDDWFPEPGDSAAVARAKLVCRTCPVRDACLEHALTFPEKAGVWGGHSAKELMRMRGHRLVVVR